MAAEGFFISLSIKYLRSLKRVMRTHSGSVRKYFRQSNYLRQVGMLVSALQPALKRPSNQLTAGAIVRREVTVSI